MNTMNSEFFEALAMLEKERGIPVSYLIEKISNAIAIAVKRDMGGFLYKARDYFEQGDFWE